MCVCVRVAELAADLQLIEAQSEVEDLGELFGQRLLPLQVLSGRERRTCQLLQQTLQSLLCRDAHTHTRKTHTSHTQELDATFNTYTRYTFFSLVLNVSEKIKNQVL